MSDPTDDVNEYVVQRIRDAIALDGRVAVLGADVRVRKDVVHIDAEAVTEAQRAALVEVAAENAHGMTIEADVGIVPAEEGGTEEDLP